MTLATHCDACGTLLHREVVALRFATLSAVSEGEELSKVVPVVQQAYLVCERCISYMDDCIAALERGAGGDLTRGPEMGR